MEPMDVIKKAIIETEALPGSDERCVALEGLYQAHKSLRKHFFATNPIERIPSPDNEE